jgi:broad specificity phosphatase PhoE
MSMRIFLIRHGATVLTAEDRFAGRPMWSFPMKAGSRRDSSANG